MGNSKFLKTLLVVFLVVAAIIAPSLIQSVKAQDCAVDQVPRIALVSAFGAEFEAWMKQIQVDCAVVLQGRSFVKGTYKGAAIVAYQSGGSMSNAAMTTERVLTSFNVTSLAFSGIAGGIDNSLNIGDVAVPAQWSEYMESLAARDKGNGEYDIPVWFGSIDPNLKDKAKFPHFQFFYPQAVWVANAGSSGPDVEDAKYSFAVDPDMLAVAKEVASKVELGKCAKDTNGVETCLNEQPKVVVGGVGVSASIFVDNKDFRDYVWTTWHAQALDMESAAFMHVVFAHGKRAIVFRSLSDLAGGGEGANEIGTFFQLAADNSAKVFLSFLDAWIASGKA